MPCITMLGLHQSPLLQQSNSEIRFVFHTSPHDYTLNNYYLTSVTLPLLQTPDLSSRIRDIKEHFNIVLKDCVRDGEKTKKGGMRVSF